MKNSTSLLQSGPRLSLTLYAICLICRRDYASANGRTKAICQMCNATLRSAVRGRQKKSNCRDAAFPGCGSQFPMSRFRKVGTHPSER